MNLPDTRKKPHTDIIDVLTVEDEQERFVIETAKTILRTWDVGYGVTNISEDWFRSKAARDAADYIAQNFTVLVDVPPYDPLMAHFQAGDLAAVERHLLARWGIQGPEQKGWVPNALER